ncbi:MAG: NfeD family protein [Thermodesulfobacteriota bacterium]
MSKGWSKKTIIKYVLLQIPMAILVGMILFWMHMGTDISPWLLWSILVIWIAKDGVIFFFVWPAYETHPRNEMLSMNGRLGTTSDRLDPSGYIHVNGTLWKARLSEETGEYLEQGREVRILGMDGLTLLVVPEKQNSSN